MKKLKAQKRCVVLLRVTHLGECQIQAESKTTTPVLFIALSEHVLVSDLILPNFKMHITLDFLAF